MRRERGHVYRGTLASGERENERCCCVAVPIFFLFFFNFSVGFLLLISSNWIGRPLFFPAFIYRQQIIIHIRKKKRATGENTKWARRLYAERWGVNQSYKSPNALHKFPAETSLLFPSFLFLVFLVFFLLLWTFSCISFWMPMSLFSFTRLNPPLKKANATRNERK